ncbi:ribosomal protein S19 [Listeria monocytogenes]|nr:ribosomal protein S19 [Listeria monocytogenes]
MERRDQVLITCFFSLSAAASTFFIKWSSTKGPFFKLRPMTEPPFA